MLHWRLMIYPEGHWFPPVGMGPAEDMITYRKVQHLCFLYTSGNSECELPRLLPKWCPTADGVRKWVFGREFNKRTNCKDGGSDMGPPARDGKGTQSQWPWRRGLPPWPWRNKGEARGRYVGRAHVSLWSSLEKQGCCPPWGVGC